MTSNITASARPYAFLFKGGLAGVPEPCLEYFTSFVLLGLSRADPAGQTQSQVRIGLPMLKEFTTRTSAVRGTATGSSWTVSYDKDIYKFVLWNWLDSLSYGWHSINFDMAQEMLLSHNCECVALSAISENTRDTLDEALRSAPGYIGGFEIDPGNPIHRLGFFDLLIYQAAVINGSVIQDRGVDGDEGFQLKGADKFLPGGLIWKDYGWLQFEGPPGLEQFDLSERGSKAAQDIAKKRALTIEGRVLEAIRRNFVNNIDRKIFEFKATDESSDVLQAIMPEGKFTKYLFARDHKKGGSKANFLIDDLDFDRDDWRYLAAQFYYGLLNAEPEALQFKEWETGYNVRFSVQMRIANRFNKKANIITGWNLTPGKLPSLSTAIPGDRSAQVLEPGDPPILLPGTRTPSDWAKLWDWANADGLRAAEEILPTPMYINGFDPVPEGECGSAAVRVSDARTGFARWLVRHGPGRSGNRGGAIVFCRIANQSLDRSIAWARAAVTILRLNGVSADIDIYVD